ncbi:hypothetical protein [Burkholderia pseudomultivorans]|uniref:hypothetical protein n=1 Tax=Burkholderia pseudomultivorans TaxID=1207504 RepID=UPI0012D9829D|nr:hypothetical protein [Burkholderia pseudomultivorans]
MAKPLKTLWQAGYGHAALPEKCRSIPHATLASCVGSGVRDIRQKNLTMRDLLHRRVKFCWRVKPLRKMPLSAASDERPT